MQGARQLVGSPIRLAGKFQLSQTLLEVEGVPVPVIMHVFKMSLKPIHEQSIGDGICE